jgi:ankyrin repeat protein
MGHRPLDMAAYAGDLETMHFLLSRGARPGSRTLRMAAWRGRVEVLRLLQERGLLPDAAGLDRSGALLSAADPNPDDAAGAARCARLLLDLGASPHVRDDEGRTPLMRARQARLPQMVRLFRRAEQTWASRKVP